MTTRRQAAENALASVRAEGLDPGVAQALLDRWACGELSDAQLDDAARRIGAGESLDGLLAPVRA
jgi:Antitoxin VbhA